MKKQDIQKEVRRFVAQHQLLLTCKTSWSTPLVGFSSADDPLFKELKKVVSKTHALPQDLLHGERDHGEVGLVFDKELDIFQRQPVPGQKG